MKEALETGVRELGQAAPMMWSPIRESKRISWYLDRMLSY